MQKVAFTRFGVSRGQKGAANSAAADFTTAKSGVISALGEVECGAKAQICSASAWQIHSESTYKGEALSSKQPKSLKRGGSTHTHTHTQVRAA